MNKNRYYNYNILNSYKISLILNKDNINKFNNSNIILKIKIKKKFLLNYMYFYRKNIPKKLNQGEIEKYSKIKNVFLIFKRINIREKIPLNEFNIWSSFLHENTRKWLERSYFEGLQKFKYCTWQPFIYFYKLLYNKFSNRILNDVLIDGSFTNMLSGARVSSDIDIAVVAPFNREREKLDEFILYMKNIKGTCLDVYLKNKILWENNTPDVLNKFARNQNIRNYDTIVKSANHCIYFCGIKVITLELYIASVCERAYPKNVFDTIQARRLFKITYPLDILDCNIVRKNKSYSCKKFLTTIVFYYRKYLNKKVTTTQIKRYLIPHNKLYNKLHNKK